MARNDNYNVTIATYSGYLILEMLAAQPLCASVCLDMRLMCVESSNGIRFDARQISFLALL